MKICSLLSVVSLATAAALTSRGADTPAAAEPTMKEELHAQLVQDAAKQSANPSAPSTATSPILPPTVASIPAPNTAKTDMVPSPTPKPDAKEAAAQAKAKSDAPTMMPKVEVRKNRITELDRQVHAKDVEIEKETEKTHATETDKALNGTKTSGLLSFLGGRSAAVGEDLARQRVMLLEVERDLVSEIALAKTKEEKADLQKQLDEIKAMRRDLEKPR